ncbi:hypothetical protein BT69DRAFT_1327810 [Atractiella rhizophila]|nr:hypothetical protein BT69DRAFT_1327810 [Atractiella rhizophila]
MASSLGSSKNTPTDVHHDLSTLSTLSPSPLHQAITEDNEDQESDDELHLHLDGQYHFADVQMGSYMAGESEEEGVENSAGLEGSHIEDGGEGMANPESGSEGHDQGGIDPDKWTAQSFRRRYEELKQEFPHLLPPDNTPPDLPTFPPSVSPDDEELLPSLCHWYAWAKTNGRVEHYNRYANNLRAQGNKILSLYETTKHIEQLTRVSPRRHDMCVNSCMAFIGPYDHLKFCPWKAENILNRNTNTLLWTFSIETLMQGLALANEADRVYKDLADGELLQTLQQCLNLSDDPRTGFFSLSTDGAQLSMKKKGEKRGRMQDTIELPIAAIPGPNPPVNIESFFYPFVEDFAQASLGVWMWIA